MDLRVEGLAAGGAGVARHEGVVVFVPGAFPGDCVRVRVIERRRRYWRAEVVEILQASPHRREPPCSLARECGGCPWMGLREEAQREAKVRLVRDALRRIGGEDDGLVASLVPAPSSLSYRTRVRLRAHGMSVGFRAARSDALVDVDSCPVASVRIREAMVHLRRALRARMPLRWPLQIELAEQEDSLSLLVRGRGAGFLGRHVFPSNLGIRLECRDKPAPRARRSFLPFGQANAEQNRRLVSLVEKQLDASPGMHLIEFYCGDGNMSLGMARQGVLVEGIEQNERAVEQAKVRAPSSARYVSGDALPWLRRRLAEGGRADRVLLNPPRAGARALMPSLDGLHASRVVYVSCDPATLARDLKILTNGSPYVLESVTPLDMMPNTAHVEVVALLIRRPPASCALGSRS